MTGDFHTLLEGSMPRTLELWTRSVTHTKEKTENVLQTKAVLASIHTITSILEDFMEGEFSFLVTKSL